MLDAALDVADPPAGIALVPGAVEVLGGDPELHDEVAGQILRLGLAPLLAPRRIRAASSPPMIIRRPIRRRVGSRKVLSRYAILFLSPNSVNSRANTLQRDSELPTSTLALSFDCQYLGIDNIPKGSK